MRYGATHPLNTTGTASNTDALRTRVIQEAANSDIALTSENITVECISSAVDAHSGSSTDCASPSVQPFPISGVTDNGPVAASMRAPAFGFLTKAGPGALRR